MYKMKKRRSASICCFLHGGFWQPTVPSWEKKFCSSVGAVPWRRLLEAKKVMSFYENVVQWNDSAGEEAFNNAKNRFWAKINGLPCDISLPDPDIYIDEIDWNSDIDPELILDLDREPVATDEGEKNGKAGSLGDSLLWLNRPVPCTGWDDLEEDPVRMAKNLSSDPVLGDCDQEANIDHNPGESGHNPRGQNASFDHNPWESGNNLQANEGSQDKTWENHGGNSWSLDPWDNNANELENCETRQINGGWGVWNRNCRKRESAAQYMSRYKTSRFHRNDYQTDRWWKNGSRGRRRMNSVYDRPLIDKKPLVPSRWNSVHYCGPFSHHGSGDAGNNWGWEKPPVS
uniref:Uncharacterized protein n=1 Tax=Nelumbo nucifera TaxID=4432 RepID=A0A822ZBN7_NELNU|nr:TPA_asm: hypothetical protein HUJ06_000772 [Nelumbo nucifera]